MTATGDNVEFITDITVVQVTPGDQHLAWLSGIHELKERLGVRGVTAQSSGTQVSIGQAIASLHHSWQRDYPDIRTDDSGRTVEDR